MIDLDLVRTRLPDHIQNPDPNIYRSNNYVVLDFETTVLGKGTPYNAENSIVLAAWELGPDHPSLQSNGRSGGRMRCLRAGEFGLGELVRDIEKADFIVAHNAKFELGWLRRCGLAIDHTVVWDTMLGEYVIGGNRWTFAQLSLENAARRRLGKGKVNVVSKMFKAGLCSTEIPASWLRTYCIQDVELCAELFLAQREYMINDGRLMPIQFTRCLLPAVLVGMETYGMQLDGEKVKALAEETEREYSALQIELEEITGGINVNSNKQLAEFLYEKLGFREATDRRGRPFRTGTGLPKTDSGTIERLRATTKEQARFLDLYRRSNDLNNQLTKYLRKFADCCAAVGGRLQGVFNQTNTRTHRLSSSGLEYTTQFQNFPRQYKPLFNARDRGNLVGEADGAQLEFRAAAHLGRDKVALGDITSGTDIHSVTSGVIGCSRQDAKAHTFKPLYGGRSGTTDEVRYYEFFREKYRGITETQQRWISAVLRDKCLRTEWGLVYYWPDTRQDRSGYVTNSTSICNYPVQAFATAEIIPIGLVYFWHYVQAAELKMLLVNTVHDSIIAEIPPDEVEWFHALAARCLIDEIYGYLRSVYNVSLTVPLGAGVKVASHWAGDDAASHVPEGVEHDKGEVLYTAKEELYNEL